MEIRRNWKPFFGLALTACVTLLTSACSSVPIVDSGERGLFQQNVRTVRVRDPGPHFRIASSDMQTDSGYIWPVKEAIVSSPYGDRVKSRRHHFHEGIDIKANRGTPVLAVKDGVVLYSARRIKGYGNMVVVKHGDGTATVYAHNKKNLVKKGDRVTRGQELAQVGATGRATGPHLHFEVRKGEIPVDPLTYLPPNRSPAVAQKETGRRLN